MKTNFDEKIEQLPCSVKWSTRKNSKGEDILPMWVADMDFKTAPEISAAMAKRANEGLFGYTQDTASYKESIVNWGKTRHNYTMEKDWITPTAGVIMAIDTAVNAFTNEGDNVVIQTPVYFPFFRSIKLNNRKINENKLIIEDGKAKVDFEDLEEKLKESKLIILCNPHNPTGKVYTEEELIKIADLCIKYDVMIFSDEIHQDLVYKGNKHISMLNLDGKYHSNIIVSTAGSKSFNIAGLSTAHAIIPNEENRLKFFATAQKTSPTDVNIFGKIALEAAYNEASYWLDEVIDYIQVNRDYAIKFAKENMPKVSTTRPDGTYFLWMDFSEFATKGDDLVDFFIEEGKVKLNGGTTFGDENCLRFNLACRHEDFKIALDNIKIAYDKLK